MESGLVLITILAMMSCTTNHVCGQMIYASENPLKVGSNVSLFSQLNITSGAWMFNNTIIVLIYPGNVDVATMWAGRATFNPNDSSLTITLMQLEDSGVYKLQAIGSFQAEIELSVQVPISNVTLTANATELVEFNDTAVLTCSVASGSSLSYMWLNGSSVVDASVRVQISDGGSTLTILNVTRYDKGPFGCNVSNSVSQGMDQSVRFSISFGPSNTAIWSMPKEDTHRTGSTITLSCSAESSPAAMIQWMVNGMNLNQSGPELQLRNVTESNSGYYKCLFYNNVTSRFGSASAMIWIMDPITADVLNHTGKPAILNEPFSLRCNVTGPVDRVQWWRNGRPVSADNTTVFDMDNKTLTLQQVEHSDGGDYQCQAFNAVSNMTSSPFTVEVNYGPKMVTIMGPKAARSGHNVTLRCSATSSPPSHYKWYFNNTLVANTSEYVTPPLTTDHTGVAFKCMATNYITGLNSSTYRMLTVYDPITDVRVEAPMKPAKENYSYMLTCNVTGPAEHVYWMKDGELLHTHNNTVVDKYNWTLIFNPLHRYDKGNYQCKAINPVENMTSSPHMLLVNFGPDEPVIYGPSYAEVGQDTYLNCSAGSMPPSQFSWWYNGNLVSNSSVLKIISVSPSNASGVYTCTAYNNVTGKKSKTSKMLTYIEKIKSVMVKQNTVPIHADDFTLTCEVDGAYTSIYWMKDGMKVGTCYSHSHKSHCAENNTLQFTPVTLYHDGTYRCVATNQLGHHKSPEFKLLVNYGPLSFNIAGPDSLGIGLPVSLVCSANSRPDCDFHCVLNYQMSAVNNGSVISFLASKEREGNYTCTARNPVTNITMYKTKAFTLSRASALQAPSHKGLMLTSLFALSVFVRFQ